MTLISKNFFSTAFEPWRKIYKINELLLYKYIYGIKKPGAARKAALKDMLRVLGKELMAV